MSSPLSALAQVSQQLDVRDAAAVASAANPLAHMQGWGDLQQLAALYILKMDKQREKMEQAARDRERNRAESIQRKWTKREEADFFRVVSSYGIDYDRKKKSYDWTRFKNMSKLEKKSDEVLTEYYKNFIIMCKKQCGIKVDDDLYDPTIEQISEDKAKRTMDRIELLSKIREDIIMHPQLEDRLKLCQTSADVPDWWTAGIHDRDLLIGVAKHGLGRTDYYILNDPELSFQEVLRSKCNSEPVDTKEAIKLESHEDILKFDKNEILVKLEKGEGTLKIEKVGVKKETDEKKEKVRTETDQVELTLVKSEKKPEDVKEDEEKEVEKSAPTTEDKEEPKKEPEKQEELESPKEEEKDKEVEEEKVEEQTEQKEEVKTDETKLEVEPEKTETPETKEDPEKPKDTKEDKPEKEKSSDKTKTLDLDKETDVTKQAAELKAMFPDLEVIQPLSRLSQIDTFVLRDKQTTGSGALDFSETTVAQLFNNAVKWPKDHAIQTRLQHICHAVENNEWPFPKNFTAYTIGIGPELDMSIHETPNTPKRDTSTPKSVSEGSEVITITTDHCIPRLNSSKKRKRHIAIDVETERAKLHALLNSAHVNIPNPLSKAQSWNDDDSEDSRRSTPIAQAMLQPPPAHQNAPRVLSMPYDLKYHVPSKSGASTVIPGTSSTLTPIDLSSGLPKMNTPDIPKVTSQEIQNEVQDFSMPSKKNQNPTSSKGKLDDMLNKLKKRNNCTVEEPVVGKEKKRRKLDEIVLGLSAAKEQSLFPESTSKKAPVTPSVTVTPTSAPVATSHSSHQKPFTITVTSVPSPAPATSKSGNLPPSIPSLSSASAKDSFSSFLAQAEQQNLLLKKQQQQAKSYEKMIADINKVADFSSKVNSYSHEAKVNKWLAEQQNSVVPEQSLSADYLSAAAAAASRRRRPRGVDPSLLDWKKLTDPKWAELAAKEARSSLSHDMKNRLPNMSTSSSNSKKGPGRPPLLGSPTASSSSPAGTSNSASASNLAASSMASTLPFPSLATAGGLGGLNSSLLSSLSLGQFDPKTNPLLLPFGGMSNMSALNSMSGLGGLGNMNLFANLAGLGIPGLAGMDALAGAAVAASDVTTPTSGSTTKSSSSKSRKADTHTSNSGSSKPPSSSASSSSSTNTLPTTSPFPFFFPNPSLLYTPLGLGGLNPFTLQPGMSAAYDSLAQQCGLLNGTLAQSPTSSRSGKSNSTSRSTMATAAATATTSTTSSRHRSSASTSRDTALQQLLLPHDAHILESISRVAGSLDVAAPTKRSKDDKKDEKRKNLESLSRAALLSDFPSPDKLGKVAKSFVPNPADLSKFMELPGSSKRMRDQEMKEALEQLSKTPAEFIARTLASTEEQMKKRPRESLKDLPENLSAKDDIEQALPPSKKLKELHDINPPSISSQPPTPTSISAPSIESGGVDIEALLPPSTVVKGPPPPPPVIEEEKLVAIPDPPSSHHSEETHDEHKSETSTKEDTEGCESQKKGAARRTRGKRKSGEMEEMPVIERKNLRSSAGRAAAAAAARQAAARQQEAAALAAAIEDSKDEPQNDS